MTAVDSRQTRRPGAQQTGLGAVRQFRAESGGGGGRERGRGVQHRAQGTVAISRRRAMSVHQVGVYPSG